MSDPSEGLPSQPRDTTARMKLSDLRHRLGSDCGPSGPPPLAVEVLGMSAEHWLRVDPVKGEATVYRLEREWTP